MLLSLATTMSLHEYQKQACESKLQMLAEE